MIIKKRRRSLTNVGGAASTGGDPEAASLLARALDVPQATMEDEADRSHVHGFHSYPARMHPVTASRLVDAFAPKGGVVFDPFCGSGTVLVEAMLAGRDAVGTDLNPLAVALARLKTEPRSPAELERLVAAARDAAAVADERRKARAGATRRFAPEDMELFDAHVLLELDGVRSGLAKLPPPLREALLLVLSALLVKLSRKQGDTSAAMAPRRIAAGYPAKLFVKKTEELARRVDAFTRALPPKTPRARVAQDDATKLKTVAARSIDCAVTSPPYVATYDYLEHHALRLRWLGLDARPLQNAEFGARRRYAPLAPADARAAWSLELESFLRALVRTLRPGARVVLLMADSAVHRTPLRADAIVAEIAPKLGLECVARASQARPHFHGPTLAAFKDAPRAEHALFLVNNRVL